MQVSSEERCRNSECHRSSFIQDYSYRGYLSEVKQQIGDMAINGSGSQKLLMTEYLQIESFLANQ